MKPIAQPREPQPLTIKQKTVALVSVTKLDDFRKFFATNFLTKVAQLFGDFWGILKTSLFK